MHIEEIKEAVREAITNHIPFDSPNDDDFETLADAVDEVAGEKDFIKALPREFKHQAWAFHLSSEKGLRWGYVRNDDKVGWFEGRESTPLPERDVVIKDSEPVYGHRGDLL